MDCPKRFPMYQASSMYQVAGFGSGSANREDLEPLPVDEERGIIFHCKLIRHHGTPQSRSEGQLLYLRCELVYSGLTFSQFLPGEFINSQFLSSFQFFHFMNTSILRFSKCSFSFRQFFMKSGLFSSGCFVSKISMVNFHTIGLNLSLKFTTGTVSPLWLCIPASVLQILPLRANGFFALQELISYHLPIQRVWIVLLFLLEVLDVPREYRLCRNEILDSTFFCVRT